MSWRRPDPSGTGSDASCTTAWDRPWPERPWGSGRPGMRWRPTTPRRLERLLDRIAAEVDLAVADVRRVIDDLRPAELDDGSLDLAVRRRAASIASVVDVDVDVGPLPDLRPEVEIAAYRIASEALNNVARHAGAQQVRLAVSAGDGSLTLRVADDGSGIPECAPAGVGLESMRRRAQAVGGTFDVDSSQDGTVVTARLPL